MCIGFIAGNDGLFCFFLSLSFINVLWFVYLGFPLNLEFIKVSLFLDVGCFTGGLVSVRSNFGNLLFVFLEFHRHKLFEILKVSQLRVELFSVQKWISSSVILLDSDTAYNEVCRFNLSIWLICRIFYLLPSNFSVSFSPVFYLCCLLYQLYLTFWLLYFLLWVFGFLLTTKYW